MFPPKVPWDWGLPRAEGCWDVCDGWARIGLEFLLTYFFYGVFIYDLLSCYFSFWLSASVSLFIAFSYLWVAGKVAEGGKTGFKDVFCSAGLLWVCLGKAEGYDLLLNKLGAGYDLLFNILGGVGYAFFWPA